MNYRRIRWVASLAASLFVWVVETRAFGRDHLVWHTVVPATVFLFTMFAFRRLGALEGKLEQQGNRYRALFEATGLGILIVDSTCMIVEANRSAEALSGWSRSDLQGRKACSDLFCPGESGQGLCPGFCPTARPHAAVIDKPVSLALRHRDGERIPVMVSLAPLGHGSQSRGHALLLWDVRDQHRLEAQADYRRRQAEGLGQIGREIAAYANLAQNMDRILDQARSLFGMDLVAWGMLDEQAKSITWQGSRGSRGAKEAWGAPLPLRGTVMGRLLLAGRAYLTKHLALELGANLRAQAIFGGSTPLQAAVAVPYRVRDNSWAVLLCATATTKSLNDEDVMLITHLGRYLATATENAELLGEVRHMAALEERQRLAREMHDSLGQTLSYIGVRLHMIAKASGNGDGAFVAAETASLKQVLAEAHTELRSSIFQLKQSGKPRASLPERWSHLLASFEERTGVKVLHSVDLAATARLDEPEAAQLTRILQEALTNVRNHSGAYSVTVTIAESAGQISLSITDDGCGFETSGAQGPERHHFGLSIMRERAASVGAAIQIRSMRGQGTSVQVQLPVTRRSKHGAHPNPAG